MVSFNHGVSSLTRKDLALKYNLCVLLCAVAAQAPGPRRSRSCRLPHDLGGKGEVAGKKTPDSLTGLRALCLPQAPWLGAVF